MKSIRLIPVVLAIVFTLGPATPPSDSAQTSGAAVQELRCEYLVSPSGIDVENPRLSWVLSPAAGIRASSAYRILAASSLDALGKEQGDLWDSGRVASQDTTWIPYAGRKLESGQRVYWKARVWGENGKASPSIGTLVVLASALGVEMTTAQAALLAAGVALYSFAALDGFRRQAGLSIAWLLVFWMALRVDRGGALFVWLTTGFVIVRLVIPIVRSCDGASVASRLQRPQPTTLSLLSIATK